MSRAEDVELVHAWYTSTVSLLHTIQNPNLAYQDPGRPGREARQLLADETVADVTEALGRLGVETTEVVAGEAELLHAAVPLLVAMAPMDARKLEDRTAEIIRALAKGAARGFAARDPNVCTTCDGLKRVKYTDAGWCTCPGCTPIVHLFEAGGAGIEGGLKCGAEVKDPATSTHECETTCSDCLHRLIADERGTTELQDRADESAREDRETQA